MLTGSDLPQTVRDLANLIGLELTMKLVQKFGGYKIYVPRTVDAEQVVEQVIGVEATRKLASCFGTEEIYLPRCYRALLAERNCRIRAANTAGTGAGKLALEHKLTVRQIWNILAATEAAADSRQAGLFPR